MESNPGNPNPDLTTLWWLILTQYGVIIGTIALFIFLLWLVTWFRDHRKKRILSSSLVPSSHANADLWFGEWEQGEFYRDFSNN